MRDMTSKVIPDLVALEVCVVNDHSCRRRLFKAIEVDKIHYRLPSNLYVP